jgi:uncharacterized protein
MIALVRNNIDKITEACKAHRVKTLYLFGSAATGNYKPGSDLDFLIEYYRDKEGLPVAGFDYFDFLFTLESITGHKVDLIVTDAIRNQFFKKKIEQQRELLYAG